MPDDKQEQLWEACWLGDLATIRKLAPVCDLNLRDKRGRSALDHASTKVYVGRVNEAAKLLVSLGASMVGRCPICTLGVGDQHISDGK